MAEDEAIADSLHLLLASQGYAVERLSLGEDCLDLLQARRFGCLLVGQFGLSSPGLKLLAELRRRGDGTPAVLVTNVMAARDYQLVDSLGGIAILEKPFAPDQVLALVDRHKALAGGG